MVRHIQQAMLLLMDAVQHHRGRCCYSLCRRQHRTAHRNLNAKAHRDRSASLIARQVLGTDHGDHPLALFLVLALALVVLVVTELTLVAIRTTAAWEKAATLARACNMPFRTERGMQGTRRRLWNVLDAAHRLDLLQAAVIRVVVALVLLVVGRAAPSLADGLLWRQLEDPSRLRRLRRNQLRRWHRCHRSRCPERCRQGVGGRCRLR
mmetsp:Transcript_62297/g.178757  ORF Transcript_62297/g.178757 Transcript_62297/m.178757 type:complete len:208 (-) Transcript_62297:544-1167(-)